MEGKMGEGGEILKNKEAVDPGKQAVDTIKSASTEEIDAAVKNKFSDPEAINTKLKQPKNESSNEKLEELDYITSKSELIKNIIGRRLNPEFHNDIHPKIAEYNNKVLLSQDPTQMKAYLAYYNLQVTKGNILNKTKNPIIPVDDFMKKFEDEQVKYNEPIETTAALSGMPPEKITQEVGEFIEISPEKQQKIIEEIGKMINAQQKINAFKLYGYADASQVTKQGEEKVKEKFTTVRETLINKGLSAKMLPSAEYFKGIETMDAPQKQKVLNEGWAYARAMMQIAFLPQDQLKYIQENTTKLDINIDAKPVGGAEKGNQYTGGMIEMEYTGGDSIIKLLTERQENLLKMIDIRQVNYLYRTPGDRKAGISDLIYFVGGINLSENTNIKGRKEGLSIFKVNDSIQERSGISGWDMYGQDAYLESNPRVNTLNIIIPKDDPRITATGVNIPDGFDGFISALTEFKKNSKGDKDKQSYIDNTIAILQTYKEVENELNQAKEIKKIVM